MSKTGITQLDIYNKLLGVNCILAYETASDYLGMNSMADRPSYIIYTENYIDDSDLECIIVDYLDTIPYMVKNSIKVTTEEQTIIDLLRNDRDVQVIQESMSYWYETHNQSFDDLNIPDDIRDIFNSYVDDAIHYYDD